jgi:prolyl 4-hydroxylase
MSSIIQEGVMNLCLYTNKKFVIRTYILLFNKKVFLHKKSFAVVHSKPYDPESTEFDVQISHANNESSQVKLIDFIQLFPNEPGLKEIAFKKIVVASTDMVSRFVDTCNASSDSSYILLGVDNLLTSQNNVIGVKIIEVNRYPNISHTSLVNSQINIKVLEDVFCKLLNIKNPLSDNFISLI